MAKANTSREIMSVGVDSARHGSGKMVLEVLKRRESSKGFEVLKVRVWGVEVPEGCLEVQEEHDAIRGVSGNGH